ncbi:hypothetical protein C9374_003066 [Naegleria lovaniensis]|uniref:Mitochondrial import inner membrane translocase subunit TIM50 n=1 Tax=Naegleria lovaniensis TaxID=51637 RepID=A0AA88KQ00_NAELO|nr:uncharacterized protein C9374_003066 [Naegleria lovaniensis]KAG2385917.1 hypothetical protein C9374_003066 [Naegleria lovaniensis]
MRKTLVLDLDNTLVASFSTSKQQLLEVCDLVVTVAREKFHDTLKIAVFKRPYLDEFLEVACSLFDVWIFTASDKSYAQPVCEQLLNSKSRFKGCLFRESLSKGVKDLSIFNVSMDQIMIIDDDEYNYQLQPTNGVAISSFGFDTMSIAREQKLDCELKNLIDLLKAVAQSETVYGPISRYKQLHTSSYLNCDLSPITTVGTPAIKSFSPFDGIDESSPPSSSSSASSVLI